MSEGYYARLEPLLLDVTSLVCGHVFFFPFFFFYSVQLALSSVATQMFLFFSPLFPCLFTALAPPVTAVLSMRPLPAHCVSTCKLYIHFLGWNKRACIKSRTFSDLFSISAHLGWKTSCPIQCQVYWKDSTKHVYQNLSIIKG